MHDGRLALTRERKDSGSTKHSSGARIIALGSGKQIDAGDSFRRDVLEGLSRQRRSIPSVHFYDAAGSELFRRITELPTYYLTRVERGILERYADRIAAITGTQALDVVDLGAGDGEKTRILLDAMRARGTSPRYVPVDVSVDALSSLITSSRLHDPDLHVEAALGEYSDALRWIASTGTDRRRLVLFLGSNIGNLADLEARRFLAAIRAALHPGDHLLVGFDLLKDPEVLRLAYDDPEGVTAEFNVNLLRRINRELGGDFDVDGFRHVATFSPIRRRMESYLASLRDQVVHIADERFVFRAWDVIHTEISSKYRESDPTDFARSAGFTEVERFFDESRGFVDALWRVSSTGGAR